MHRYQRPDQIGEVTLCSALLYHALNGFRILLVDFVLTSSHKQKKVFWAIATLIVALFIVSVILCCIMCSLSWFERLSPADLASTRSPHWPVVLTFLPGGRFQWMMQRATALLLIFFAFFHFGLYFTLAGSTGLTVAERMNNPFTNRLLSVSFSGDVSRRERRLSALTMPPSRSRVALLLWYCGLLRCLAPLACKHPNTACQRRETVHTQANCCWWSQGRHRGPAE